MIDYTQKERNVADIVKQVIAKTDYSRYMQQIGFAPIDFYVYVKGNRDTQYCFYLSVQSLQFDELEKDLKLLHSPEGLTRIAQGKVPKGTDETYMFRGVSLAVKEILESTPKPPDKFTPIRCYLIEQQKKWILFRRNRRLESIINPVFGIDNEHVEQIRKTKDTLGVEGETFEFDIGTFDNPFEE